MSKRWLAGLLAALVVVAGGGFALWSAVRPPAISDFYTAPSSLGADTPGDVLRSESVDSQVSGARIWRLLYSSTDLNDEPTAVSGLVAAPTDPAPRDGYPLVVVAHGTVGINQGCAPSIAPFAAVDDTTTTYDYLIGQYVRAGYAVVMSDFEGLGVVGQNSYLVGETEGRNVLDSARAVSAFSEIQVQPGAVISGQSQGGHAALFAGLLAPTYAPDVTVLGVAALAPATDLQQIFTGVLDAGRRGGIVSLPIMAADAYATNYPNVSLDEVLTRRGIGSLSNVIEPLCLFPALLGTQLATPQDLLQPDGLEVLQPYIEKNTPAAGPFGVPLFLGQGDADEVVRPPVNAKYEQNLCDAGNAVTSKIYPQVGHFDIIGASETDVMAWIEQVRSGNPTETTCSP